MGETKSYFFCGIGGSGMLPLATIVRAQGAKVAGSDRARDQGRTPEKFDFLEREGIDLYPQDGSGLTGPEQVLVTSAAVEESIPDVQAARRVGAEHVTRPQLLARLFNDAQNAIGVAGTSGKSTVTGMIGWILHRAGRDPTVMNGAVMKNFAGPENPFASALAGSRDLFVSEVDESDGSIALYEPTVAVLNNVSLDHKSMEELSTLFTDFSEGAGTLVFNLDDEETLRIGGRVQGPELVGFSLRHEAADLLASGLEEEPLAISFAVREKPSGETARVRLQVPGVHNVYNALAALGAVRALGVPLREASEALGGFTGLRRRFDVVGTAGGVTVIDDFGHNPDKIAATLATLHACPGRVLAFFQPHGHGPLRQMGAELADAFAGGLAPDDVLILCDPVYYGGTTDRSVGSEVLVDAVEARGRHAEHHPARENAGRRLAELARPGDRIVIMGARDDTLSRFARELLESIG
jgi:UDP-N-acetylmuramate--alanine ligase